MQTSQGSSGIWYKSSFSPPDVNCVEVRFVNGGVQLRNSNDCGSGLVQFTRAEWDAFLLGAFHGEFGHNPAH